MKEVVVFNDIAGIADCTLGVALPILSVCDCKVYPVPTAVFSSSTRVTGVRFASLSNFLPKVAEHWAELDFAPDAALIGCFADECGVKAALPIVKLLKERGAFVMVDPVMGDDGKIWASPEHVRFMYEMVRMSDLTCPNFTEFCALLSADYQTLDAASFEEKLAFFEGHVGVLGVPKVIVTGVRKGDEVANFVYDEGKVSVCIHPFHHQGVCGTGDMFSNIVMARTLWGKPLVEAVQFAGEWIEDLMKELPAKPEYGMYLGGERLFAVRKGIL